MKVNDGYEAGESGDWQDESSSYEEVEVEIESGDLSEAYGLMDSTIKPPETAFGGLNSQDVVEDLGLDDMTPSNGGRNTKLSAVNNILLND